MKKLIVIASVILLTGCSTAQKLYDSYFLAPYDNIEYALVIKLRTQAERTEGVCVSKKQVEENLEEMYWLTRELKNYTQHVDGNDDAFKLANNLVDLVNSTKEHYINNKEVGVVYCRLKMKQIYGNAESIQKVIGAKPR